MRDAVLVQVIEAVEEGVKDHLDSRFLGELSSIPSSDSSDTNDEMREKNAGMKNQCRYEKYQIP